ncbi:olfactory receptor 1G1-like [Microcaecilia unicolor]|uniref:Olfactory receptor n=1 Tax=Microcaecilia unicolor TaxID=1415580 RepID=A0A6P7WVT8_9AMPH|nr:olfactory receptor 1G1-like [Microcaecilia unicolor]
MENQTSIREFIILGFPELPHLQTLLFGLFLVVYLIAVLANLLIFCTVCTDRRLHTPMFFFLCNLSVIDVCYMTATLPKLLKTLWTQQKAISPSSCALQMYSFMGFLSTEFSLLTAMAYDRYVAICDPLRYVLIMNKEACILLVVASWVTGFLDTMPHYLFVLQSSFCGSNEINHFFCDLTALMKLSCSDTFTIETVTYVEGIFLGLGAFLLTLTSYVFIIVSILKIRSSKGRHKAFSTCSSHLTVVIVFYLTTLCMYMRPPSVYSMEENKLINVVYVTIIPLLNPLIYSLRNNELKGALWKITVRKIAFVSGKVDSGTSLVPKTNDNLKARVKQV